jgi:hypothetical protein
MIVPLSPISYPIEGKTVLFPQTVSVLYYASTTDKSYNNVSGNSSLYCIKDGILWCDINLAFKYNMLAGLTLDQISTMFSIVPVGLTIRSVLDGSTLIIDLKSINIFRRNIP